MIAEKNTEIAAEKERLKALFRAKRRNLMRNDYADS